MDNETYNEDDQFGPRPSWDDPRFEEEYQE